MRQTNLFYKFIPHLMIIKRKINWHYIKNTSIPFFFIIVFFTLYMTASIILFKVLFYITAAYFIGYMAKLLLYIYKGKVTLYRVSGTGVG